MSQKWICNDCGATFDEEDAEIGYEMIGEGVMRGLCPMEMLCPECGSDSLEEAEECDWCGETYDKYDLIHVDDTKMCKKCAEGIHDAYEEKWGKMRMADVLEKRMLSDKEGADYVGLGKTSFRAWSEQIGAVRKFGKRRLNDRAVIDEALNNNKGFEIFKK